MKKLLLILTSVMLLMTSCSGDGDNNLPEWVTYDKTKGYLTNLESAKYGLIGTWKISFEDGTTITYKFDGTNFFETFDYGDDYPQGTLVSTYSVIFENSKYYILITSLGIPQEILKLNKTKLYWRLGCTDDYHYIRQ